MPGLDRKGPMGQGSQTGRGLGNCQPGNSENVEANNTKQPLGRFGGRGLGRGLAAGRGLSAGRRFGGRGRKGQ